MNCHEAEHLIFSGDDPAAGRDRSAGLAAHLADCAACRSRHDALAAALSTWRARIRSAAVPDSDRAWTDLRRVLRHGGVDSARSARVPAWLATPLAAAAAFACMMVLAPDAPISTSSPEPRHFARAEFVEVPSRTASTVVYVDDESGWLVVWASDTAGSRI